MLFNMFDSDHKPLQNKTPMKRWLRWLAVAVLAAAIILFDILTGWIKFPPARSYGSTPGNLANGGLVAESDGWIYYYDSVRYDNKSINKMRLDGSEKTRLIDGLQSVMSINAADGWIYFAGSGLYKMRTDGTSLSKLADRAFHLCMEDGWLYYVNYDESGFYLCRMGTDGIGKSVLIRGAFDITIADGWIYYSNIDDGFSLNKVRVDGTDKTKLSERQSWQITVSGDHVYFSTPGEEYHRSLYKIRIDGTGETKLTEKLYESFNVTNGWIYYCQIDDKRDLSLHKMRTNGTGDLKLGGNAIIHLYIAGDRIFYYNPGLCSMKLDGTENRRVE